jgi:hypothetical protein
MCSGRAVRRWVGSAGIVFFSIGSLVGGVGVRVVQDTANTVLAWWSGGVGDCSRMINGRVGGLVLEHLFEVMKLTICCMVGMITPICEGWVWSGFGVVNWSGGEKSNAHTVGLVGLLYESGATAER